MVNVHDGWPGTGLDDTPTWCIIYTDNYIFRENSRKVDEHF